jgi:taurine dioxygenase
MGNQTFQEIHRALAENLVIFFRDSQPYRRPASRVRPQLWPHIHPAAPHEPTRN